jgi:hypothetical protein
VTMQAISSPAPHQVSLMLDAVGALARPFTVQA